MAEERRPTRGELVERIGKLRAALERSEQFVGMMLQSSGVHPLVRVDLRTLREDLLLPAPAADVPGDPQ